MRRAAVLPALAGAAAARGAGGGGHQQGAAARRAAAQRHRVRSRVPRLPAGELPLLARNSLATRQQIASNTYATRSQGLSDVRFRYSF